MARFRLLAIPAALVIAVGIWWSAEMLMQPEDPVLGPAVVITPTGTPGSGTPTPTEPPSTTPGDGASTVPPAPPPDAGDDDDDDDHDDDGDEDDDD